MKRLTLVLLSFIVHLTAFAAHAGNFDPIDDTETEMESRIYNRAKNQNRVKYRTQTSKATSDFQISPVVSYLNTGWEGVTSKTGTYLNTGEGGKVSAGNGFGVGASVLYGQDMFQFETGLTYAQRSVSYSGYLKNSNGTLIGYQGSIDQTVSYLELPLMARFSFPSRSESHVFVHGGLVTALKIAQNTEISDVKYSYSTGYFYPAYYQTNDASVDGTMGSLKSIDYRGVVGLGGNLNITDSLGLTLSADYQRSLMPINNSGPYSIYLQGFGVSAGVLFSL